MRSSRGAQQTIRGFLGIRHEGEPETVAEAPARRGRGLPLRALAPAQPVVAAEQGHGSPSSDPSHDCEPEAKQLKGKRQPQLQVQAQTRGARQGQARNAGARVARQGVEAIE
eukprot:283882-Chlamydomonas_euryale.AAC.2